jgi:hypothetical protein
MYAVIFRATVKTLDPDYQALATQLRERALSEYNCLEFTAVTEGRQEIALSYWRSLEDIQRWKSDPLHRQAQSKGQHCWYSDYRVEVVEILRQYQQRESLTPEPHGDPGSADLR